MLLLLRNCAGRALVLGLLACALPAWSANVGITPITITLPANARSTSLTLTNNELTPVFMKARLYTWGKSDGADDLKDTPELVLTPPVFRIEPKGTQTLRVGRPGAVPVPDVEKSYRLVISELAISDPGTTTGAAAANHAVLSIATLLKLSVPVFVPPTNVERSLQWKVAAVADQEALLDISNAGTVHQKVSHCRLLDASGAQLLDRDEFVYVLPKQTSRLSLALNRKLRARESLRLEYVADAAPASVDLQAP